MPILPSGRRIEFSLDRFHALLKQMSSPEARQLAASVEEPDDLLFVMDVVHFALEDGRPFFAGCVASEWEIYAADWTAADRQALLAWFASADARDGRAEAIDYIKALFLGGSRGPLAYPYVLADGSAVMTEGARLLQ